MTAGLAHPPLPLQWILPLRQLLEACVLPVGAGYAIAAHSSNATAGKVEKGVEALEKGLSDVRADITALRGEMREEMAALRGELREEMAALRGEMAALRGELRGEMAALRGELKEERYFVLGVVVLLGGMGSTALYQALKPR